MSLPRISGQGRGGWVARLVAAGLGQAAIAFGAALVVQQVLDGARHSRVPWMEVAGLLGLASLGYAMRLWEGACAETLGQEYVVAVRRRLIGGVFVGATRADRDPRRGATQSRLISDLAAVRNWVSRGLARGLSASAVVLGLVLVLAFHEPWLAAGVLGTAAILAFVGSRVAVRLGRLDRAARRRRGRLAVRVVERIGTPVIALHLGRERAELRRARRLGDLLGRAQVRRSWPASALRHLPDLFHACAVGWLVLVGAHPDAGGRSLGGLGFSLILLGMIGTALRDLASAWGQRVVYLEALRRLRWLDRSMRSDRSRSPGTEPVSDGGRLAGVGEAAGRPVGQARRGTSGAGVDLERPLELDGVAFGKVLRDVSLDPAPGARILVTGPGGAGKTTLFKLAAGLLVPTAGSIRVSGVAPHRVRGSRRARRVQWVSPEIPLWIGTVRANIGYGVPGADPAWIETVAGWCGIPGDGAGFPDGLESRCGERGAGFSASAQSRVALARAVAVRPRLLLVDDPAFALDPALMGALMRVGRELGLTWAVVGGESLAPLIEPTEVWRVGDGTVAIWAEPTPSAGPWQLAG